MSRMDRKWLIGVVFVAAFVMLIAPVSGSSVHLKGGSHSEPAFTDNGSTLTGAGELAGLGNGDALVSLAARANPTATCGNPGTNTWHAPGHNPAPVEGTGSPAIPDSEIKR